MIAGQVFTVTDSARTGQTVTLVRDPFRVPVAAVLSDGRLLDVSSFQTGALLVLRDETTLASVVLPDGSIASIDGQQQAAFRSEQPFATREQDARSVSEEGELACVASEQKSTLDKPVDTWELACDYNFRIVCYIDLNSVSVNRALWQPANHVPMLLK
jgi:hypothetical protein